MRSICEDTELRRIFIWFHLLRLIDQSGHLFDSRPTFCGIGFGQSGSRATSCDDRPPLVFLICAYSIHGVIYSFLKHRLIPIFLLPIHCTIITGRNRCTSGISTKTKHKVTPKTILYHNHIHRSSDCILREVIPSHCGRGRALFTLPIASGTYR